MFSVEMVEYLKSIRTLSQEDVDALASTRAKQDVTPEDAYEAHSHHAEHIA